MKGCCRQITTLSGWRRVQSVLSWFEKGAHCPSCLMFDHWIPQCYEVVLHTPTVQWLWHSVSLQMSQDWTSAALSAACLGRRESMYCKTSDFSAHFGAARSVFLSKWGDLSCQPSWVFISISSLTWQITAHLWLGSQFPPKTYGRKQKRVHHL